MAPANTCIVSDLTIDVAKFDPSVVVEETVAVKNILGKACSSGPEWWDVGAAEYRKMRDEGKLPFPPPPRLPRAKDMAIPSRDGDRDIPIRVIEPENGRPSVGIILHFHGGGLVVNTNKDFDSVLARYADENQLTAMSVGYRLAPEHTYPAAPEDCVDAAEYLIDHGKERFGSILCAMTGESAGGYLSVLTAFAVMRSRPNFSLAALVLNFAQFDLTSGLPGPSTYTKPLIINNVTLPRSAEAYTPGMSAEDRKAPGISPMFEDMVALADKKRLPPAIFHIGTDDPFLDENILMNAKWQIAGGEAILKFYAGAPHGFTMLGGPGADEAAALTRQFLSEKLGVVDK